MHTILLSTDAELIHSEGEGWYIHLHSPEAVSSFFPSETEARQAWNQDAIDWEELESEPQETEDPRHLDPRYAHDVTDRVAGYCFGG